MVTFGPDGEIPDYRGVICAPWPNRLADGTYSYAGRSFEAAINEPERGTALHGLLTGVDWELRGHTADSVTLAGTVEAGRPIRPALTSPSPTACLRTGSVPPC